MEPDPAPGVAVWEAALHWASLAWSLPRCAADFLPRKEQARREAGRRFTSAFVLETSSLLAAHTLGARPMPGGLRGRVTTCQGLSREESSVTRKEEGL